MSILKRGIYATVLAKRVRLGTASSTFPLHYMQKGKKKGGGAKKHIKYCINGRSRTLQVPTLWPLAPKIDTATWTFFGLSDMRHGL